MRTSGVIEYHASVWYFNVMIRKIHLNIESMAYQGYGVGRFNGKVIFVPHTITGDEVWVEITEEKKRYSIGRLSQIVHPSSLRVNPPCPYFGVCGGCHWQHINPSIHGEMKQTILSDILKRLGELENIPPIDVIPSPKPYGYRVRVQLKVNGKAMGYFQERSRRIVEIHHCPIAHPLVNQIIQKLREQPDAFSSLEEIEINVSPEQGKGVLLFHPHSYHQRFEHFAKEFLQSQPILWGIAIVKKGGWTPFGNPSLSFKVSFRFMERERNLLFRISPGSFSQVNLEQNDKLIQTVVEFSGAMENERVLDLYAGVGNLTLPLAIHAREVWGIEENRMAVEDAKFNTDKNGIQNAHFIPGKVEQTLKNWGGGKPDLVVLDPPRIGCQKVIDLIVKLDSKKIVYVSCEPTTLSRDLHLFSERGYSLQKLYLIDMFPQTYHMEVVGLLQKVEA